MTLGAKITAAWVGTLVLAIVSVIMATVSGLHSRSVLETVVADGLLSLRAVAELEISLLEQRGFVSSYILDGDRAWLDELERREPGFTKWREAVRRLPRTGEERRILGRLDAVFAEYADARAETVALYDAGHVARARHVFTSKVNPLYRRAYVECEELVAVARKRIQMVVNDARSGTERVAVIAFALTGVTIAIGAALLVAFVRNILRPLRRMAHDARAFRGTESLIPDAESPRDELRVIGSHLQALMLDVEQARSRLANSQKLASVGKLAACVAHEIRNPLSSLKMRLFAVTRELGADPLYEDDLRVMSEEITRLEEVVSNFLEFARPPRLEPQPCEVSALIDKTLEMVRHRLVEKDITVERSGEGGLPRVLADPGQMRQVFLNLIMNAADAMTDGGRLQIASSLERTEEAGAVVIRVTDSGGGIPPESVGQILEPFFSLKEEGTGLGLSIAAHIMARHSGSLKLEASSPQGTTFAVSIPLADKDG
jgi:signal transduction histidine kinase